MAAQNNGNIVIAMIIMDIWALGPLRPAPPYIEAVVVSIFVLFLPDNDVCSDNRPIGKPIAGDDIFSFMPNVHSVSLDIERCFRLKLDTCNFLRVLVFLSFQAWLSLNVF